MSASPHVAVIGAGITGLTAAHRLRTASPGAGPRVTLLEASERLGGWVRTERFAGRAVDYGPDSLLARSPWARELCEELGLADRLVAPGAGASLLLRGGRLRVLPRGILAGLPGGPRPFVRAGLLGPLGVARAALDLVLPENGPPAGADESVGALIRRRFGGQALERVIDPLLGGVHAGRCDELSLRATAPHLAAGAAADRSLLRGLRAVTPPAPAGAPAAVVFEGPREGMQTIADALADRLRDDEHVRIACGSPITDLAALPGDVDAVILATPAAATARLLEPHAPTAAAVLRDIRHATIAHVTFAFDPADLPLLPQATGFLVPAAEGLLLTACTFVDRKWPLRPRDRDDPLAGTVVLRCSAGRSGDRRAGDLDDDQLAARLLSELSSILDVRDAPRDVRVRRFRDAMPQYAPGHLERIDAVTDAVRRALPQVELAGAAYRGSSVPQCIRDGRAAADAVLAQLADTRSIGEGTTS